MKRLILVRHAKATRDAKTPSDHARPLSPKGIWAAEEMARHCAKQLRQVDVALCSSAIRTRETLRLFAQYLPPFCKSLLEDTLYLAESNDLLVALQSLDERFDVALLVGHEPGLSDLADTLCRDAGNAKARKKLANGFKTSALATIDLRIDHWAELRPDAGKLREMIRPKDLR